MNSILGNPIRFPGAPEGRWVKMRGRAVPYLIRRSPRAKRVLLKVEPDRGLVVVLPSWFSTARVPAVILAHGEWVLKHLEERGAEVRGQGALLSKDMRVPYLGADVALRVEACQPGKRTVLCMKEGEVVIASSSGCPSHPELLPLLKDWYRRQAREVFSEKIGKWVQKLGVRPARLRVTDPRTQWGSCSTSGTVSLSWRLLLAPQEVMEYIVVHELCHLKHPDHSKRFWTLLSQMVPEYPAHQAWLRLNGGALRVS